MTLTLRYAARSDRGLIRDGNQDSVYAGPRLLAVADGMGGMAAGDVASNIVIEALAPLDEDAPGDAPIDSLRSAVDLANQHLRETVDANPAMEGMGTTLTALLFSGTKFGTVHIGDSRGYLLRDGEFMQITKDDTYVQMLVDDGRISAEEASSHPQRSLLTRAMDGRDVDPEYAIRPAVPGDRYLICSDGLTAVVSAETIADTLREYVDPAECVERLVQLALRGGGPDNITVIVADVTDEDIVEQQPMVGGAAARDRGLTPSANGSTPASRAASLSGPRPAAPTEEPEDVAPPAHRKRPLRTAIVLVVLIAILGGLIWGGWYYTQQQYYVGVNDTGQVVIYRGIPGKVAGLHLSSVYYEPAKPLRVEQLTLPNREKVKQGITVSSAAAARRTLDQLLDPASGNQCDPSATPLPTSVPSPTDAAPGPGTSGSASPTSAASTSVTPSLSPSTVSPSPAGPSPLPPC